MWSYSHTLKQKYAKIKPIPSANYHYIVYVRAVMIQSQPLPFENAEVLQGKGPLPHISPLTANDYTTHRCQVDELKH